ncbi:MAG: hypothetical protein ACI4XM_03230 [Candidatus Coprovivens sp.]
MIVKKKCTELEETIKSHKEAIDEYDEFVTYFPTTNETSHSPFENIYVRLDIEDERDSQSISSSRQYQFLNINDRKKINSKCYMEIFFILNKILNDDSQYDEYIHKYSMELLFELNLYIFNSYIELIKKEIESLTQYRSVSPNLVDTTEDDIEKKINDLIAIFGEEYVNAVYHRANVVASAKSNLITKLRNVGSHGEFDYNSGNIILKNKGNIVQSLSGNDYFKMSELNDISEEIIEKVCKVDTISPDLFSPMIDPLFRILKGTTSITELNNLPAEEKKELIFLLISLSLFSLIQLNSENMFKFLANYNSDTFMSKLEISLISNSVMDFSNNRQNPRKVFLDKKDKNQIRIFFENIKNAIGHNNVILSFSDIICKNIYKKNQKDIYIEISFLIIDWLNFIADNSFYKMISMSSSEQKRSIIHH